MKHRVVREALKIITQIQELSPEDIVWVYSNYDLDIQEMESMIKDVLFFHGISGSKNGPSGIFGKGDD